MLGTHPVLDTLADLVRIESVNPAYGGGGGEAGEAGMARYISRFFADREMETREQAVFPGRRNVIACLPGRNSGRRIVFEAHMDTVSAEGMTISPFEAAIDAGRLYGRGACDTKGGLAAMMHALVSVKATGIAPPCEIWLAATVDEEFSYRGVVKLCEGLTATAAVVAEPTELRAVRATKGVLRWRIRARGVAAHSSKPHLGVNAITHMARVVLALESDNAALAGSRHPLLGPATCSVGLIRGGTQVNFVPHQCEIEVDRRLLPGEAPEDVLRHYSGLLEGLKAGCPALDCVAEPPGIVDAAMETPGDAAPVRLASEILAEMGLEPTPAGVPFGSDASKLSRHGVPSILFGPGSIDQAHAAVEFVPCEAVEQAVEFYRQFMLRFE